MKSNSTHLESIQDALVSSGMTVREAAESAGLSYTTVSRILKGTTHPSLTTVVKLADALDLGTSELQRSTDSLIQGLIAPAVSPPLSTNKSAFGQRIILPQIPALILDPWRKAAEAIASDSSRLFSLPWRAFEDLVAHLLEHSGWDVEPMGYTKDGGIDLIAARIVQPGVEFRMMVQCKKLASHRRVGVEVVREVWAVKWQHGFHNAMIATTSGFTSGARASATSLYLDLRDHEAIAAWCRARAVRVSGSDS